VSQQHLILLSDEMVQNYFKFHVI